MSELRQRTENYLAMRRALGHKLSDRGRLLMSFVDFIEQAGTDHVSVELALAWATLPQGVQPVWWSQRLGVVRGFARHLAAIDERTEVPPTDALAAQTSRTPPHIYSSTEITALMAEAKKIRFPLKAATYETLIGLLASCGLRVGEAIRLERGDVDLRAGHLVIRESKFRKSRLVPLHPSTRDALGVYAKRRDGLFPDPKADSFFITLSGTRLHHTSVNETFRRLVQAAGLETDGRRRPRPHDLRHSFAVGVLLGWLRGGVEVAPRLPALSTYLGHLKPSSTYWYLEATPELLAFAVLRLEARP
jgi:integrase/recombinase XerD